MTTPTITSALRMHKALMIASRLVTRAASSNAYDLIAGCHPFAAKDMADLIIELGGMGYVDELKENRGPATPRRNRLRVQPAEDEVDE